MFLNAAIIGALVLALVLRFGQRAEVAAWAFSYLMLLLCGLYYPVSVLPRGAQFLAQLHPADLFSRLFPALLWLPGGIAAPPALRVRPKCDISLAQLRPGLPDLALRLPAGHFAAAVGLNAGGVGRPKLARPQGPEISFYEN